MTAFQTSHAAIHLIDAVDFAIAVTEQADLQAILERLTRWTHDGAAQPGPATVEAAIVIRAHEWAEATRRDNRRLAAAASRDLGQIVAAVGRASEVQG